VTPRCSATFSAACLNLLLCACVVSCAGCSAIGTRITEGGYFAGVRGDFEMVFDRGSIDPESRVSPVLAVVDVPFSLVGDILFLPYDVYCDCRSSHGTNAVVAAPRE